MPVVPSRNRPRNRRQKKSSRFSAARSQFQSASLRVILSLHLEAREASGQPLRRVRLAAYLRGFAPRGLLPLARGLLHFGAFEGLPVAWVERRIDLLIESGYLESGEGGALDLTARGVQAACGREIPAPDAGAEAPPPPLAGKDADLAGRLAALRAGWSRQEKRPAFSILPNRLLGEMVAKKPRNLGELAALPGMGGARIERYGRKLLDALDACR